MVEITPSEFVKGSLATIYAKADEIFEDLMDLSGVVVFFDEMDALVQTREGGVHLDIASQFLTTTMLPKLTRLHDHAQVVFFMATNFQDRFDAAIKRAGRFDLLLCMGPPKLSEKLHRVHRVYSMEVPNADTKKVGAAIKKFIKDDQQLQDQLSLYTFGEYKAFLKTIADAESSEKAVHQLAEALSRTKGTKFREQLKDYSQYVTLKLSDLDPLDKLVPWTTLADLDKETFTLKDVEKKNAKKEAIPITHIIRYFCDRQQSKEQY
jgi:SpoVK/Ycf46/Vps4 family AAA+-type ATPase